MKNDCHKKTAVELRIQKSMIKTMGHAAAHSTRSAPVSISLLGIVTRFYELERQCSKFSTDVDIHLAEIHTIMAIHNNEGIHVGGLAEQLGVTKGSVSELLRRLERKGLAYKAKDPLKMTRLNVFLTEKGKAAHKQHMDFHSQLDCMVDDAMGARKQDEVADIADFLEKLLARLNTVEVK
ncbi:winged helix-turn-helix transcriptional regulator [Desulfovibrio desulfuricans]|uniref:MarR family winged helix-turn-helix transcriptional regulator n=1 Tax=Desulfovibrio desulfuricans TaxID=876 RepID=UPI001785317E|nr:MarR family winged helix-turn-helix transcriptional regulator [Desulfovibrio desulfuricans]MBD8895608.1 winged helix-turn-helix transcriptional regulator [Desulfovibrio desulfuricans]